MVSCCAANGSLSSDPSLRRCGQRTTTTNRLLGLPGSPALVACSAEPEKGRHQVPMTACYRKGYWPVTCAPAHSRGAAGARHSRSSDAPLPARINFVARSDPRVWDGCDASRRLHPRAWIDPRGNGGPRWKTGRLGRRRRRFRRGGFDGRGCRGDRNGRVQGGAQRVGGELHLPRSGARQQPPALRPGPRRPGGSTSSAGRGRGRSGFPPACWIRLAMSFSTARAAVSQAAARGSLRAHFAGGGGPSPDNVEGGGRRWAGPWLGRWPPTRSTTGVAGYDR